MFKKIIYISALLLFVGFAATNSVAQSLINIKQSSFAKKINQSYSIIVGNNGSILASLDGVVWHQQMHDVPGMRLRGVAWNGNLWVVIGNFYGSDGVILTSPDGIHWTRQTDGVPDTNLRSVAWNGAQWIVVGNSDGKHGVILTSLDGITWVQHTRGVPHAFLFDVIWCDLLLLVLSIF